MRLDSVTRVAGLALLLGGLACAGNKTDDQVGAAKDSTAAARSDTTTDQTQSGMTDSSGQSTLGKDVQKTRPDQGQPVTSKGDTLNPGVDSASVRQRTDTSSMRETMDSSSMPGMDTSSMRPPRDTSGMGQSMDTSVTHQGADSSHIRQGMDSSTTQR
jgi:hypothetical protein